MRSRRAATVAGLLAACAVAASAGTASADSIVYAKAGDLYLSSPDASKGYRLTFDGGWSDPSQADDGTIGAVHRGLLARLNRRGQELNAEIPAMGDDPTVPITGPYEPRISPDGSRFAYWFYVQSDSPAGDGSGDVILNTGSYGAWTWADHFTNPAADSAYQRSFTSPEWLTGDRLLVAEDDFLNMWTWQLDWGGPGYNWHADQYWFGLQDPPDQWGVSAFHWYDDPALSPDGSKLAMTDDPNVLGDHTSLLFATTNGPAYSGAPPYDEPNRITGLSDDLERPTLRCIASGIDHILNPSWSSDSRLLAWSASNGVHVTSVRDDADCSQITDAVIDPAGSEPAFGRANVNMADAPAPPPAGGTGPGGPTPPPSPASGTHGSPSSTGGPTAFPATFTSAPSTHVSAVSLRPRSFRAGRHGGTRVTFRLSKKGSVTLTVRTAKGRAVRGQSTARGRAGLNTIRFTGRIGGRSLKPGAYRLTVTVHSAGAPPATAAVPFRITR